MGEQLAEASRQQLDFVLMPVGAKKVTAGKDVTIEVGAFLHVRAGVRRIQAPKEVPVRSPEPARMSHDVAKGTLQM